MRIISSTDCRAWLKAKLGKEFAWAVVKEEYSYGATYRVPADTGQMTALARLLAGSIDTTRSGLFWITGSGSFPSSENMALFDGFRRSMGELRSLDGAAGHLFSGADIVQIECLVGLSLYFYWDASLFDASGIWIETSHDEYFSVRATSAKRLSELEGNLNRLKLKRLS